MQLIECNLKFPEEPLQILYPKNYQGEKSGTPEDEEFFLTTTPKKLSLGEVELAKNYVATLTYQQAVVKTGCVMGMHPDVANFTSNAEMNIYEQNNGLPSTTDSPQGGKRSLRERQLLVSERLM